jgi:hypothetical protein
MTSIAGNHHQSFENRSSENISISVNILGEKSMLRYLWILLLLVMFAKASQASQVIPIPPIEKCFLCSSEPSLTMHWQGKNSKVLLLFILGGGGQIGLKPNTSDHGFHFHQTLKRLTNPDLTSGSFDVTLLLGCSPPIIRI